jgi:hypothetical protein
MNFHERFNILIPADDLQQKFINRVNILIMDDLVASITLSNSYQRIEKNIAIKLGQEIKDATSLEEYYEDDYYKCVQTLEELYISLIKQRRKKIAQAIAKTIKDILNKSEFDLGIEWKNGQFILKGAEILDKELINKSLDWLDKNKYRGVYNPFSLGLKHFLESEKNPDLLNNVIRDMYEALEALAKIITNRNKDLSANKDLFISKVKASNEYKAILKAYINYANNYRHAESLNKERAELKPNEVESFIYLTGLFIRFCIK